jgi:hypothetical protein
MESDFSDGGVPVLSRRYWEPLGRAITSFSPWRHIKGIVTLGIASLTTGIHLINSYADLFMTSPWYLESPSAEQKEWEIEWEESKLIRQHLEVTGTHIPTEEIQDASHQTASFNEVQKCERHQKRSEVNLQMRKQSLTSLGLALQPPILQDLM